MTYNEEHIIETLDTIFSGVVAGGLTKDLQLKKEQVFEKLEVCARCTPIFKRKVPAIDGIFLDEYAILAKATLNADITQSKSYLLNGIRVVNKEAILKDQYIDKSRYKLNIMDAHMTDDDIIEAIASDVMKVVNRVSTKIVTDEQFIRALDNYLEWAAKEMMQDALNDCSIILLDKKVIRRGKSKVELSGLNDAMEYMAERENIIKQLNGDIGADNIRSWQEVLLNRMSDGKEAGGFTVRTGINKLDESLEGGISGGNIVTILGKTKGGKTRFTCYLAMQAAIQGHNVHIHILDGDKESWQAMLTVAWIAIKYGKFIDSNEVYKNKFKNTGDREIVKEAAAAMLVDETIGNISIEADVLNTDTYIEWLDNYRRNKNWFDVLVIDPMVNISPGKTSGGSKPAALARAYINMRGYVANDTSPKKLIVLSPAQVKMDTVAQMYKNPDTFALNESDGGDTSETTKTPNLVLGVVSTMREVSANQMRIQCVAYRDGEVFDDINVKTRLGSCYYEYDDSINR